VVRGADWAVCAEEARRSGAEAVITTEKDAIKISDPPPIPLRVAIQSTRIVEGDEFGDILKRAIGVIQ
jgi:tetraacyldisaccharide-1-P 4'-kinase